jgi:hypothetical protein
VPPRKRPYEAGCREETGRVMEPRHWYRRGQQESPHGGREGKADGVQWPEGSSRARVMASVQDTTGV